MRRRGVSANVNTSNPLLGGSNNGLVRWAIARDRTRKLQLATGGRYKYFIVSKIINYLKTQFLECRDCKFGLAELLEKVNEVHVSEEMIQWLTDEGLPSSSRIRQLSNGKYTYQPPLTCTTEKGLLKVLKARHENGVGGLLRSLVEDSMPIANRFILNLLEANLILQVTRNDKEQVLFYKHPEPEIDALEMEERVVELWRKIDVSNKEMSHIKMYLAKQKMNIFDDEAIDKKQTPLLAIEAAATADTSTNCRKRKKKAVLPKPKPPPKRTRRVKKVRDNAHVEDQLNFNLGAFGEEEHQ
ncbi:General transcription factor IIE subunit 2 [Orchesella cincta]|uniref:General transcription factor IIE subunit 2 n=1 Tax=Orchesella cincta TaxID=48709 RepID=A0A1D2MKB0_ORCCI|nr:General transcription factor IIE subunit 2 [Orchesella cincta]